MPQFHHSETMTRVAEASYQDLRAGAIPARTLSSGARVDRLVSSLPLAEYTKTFPDTSAVTILPETYPAL